MIEGQYTGLAGSSGTLHHVIGTNCPRSKISTAGWGFSYVGAYAGDASTFALTYGNFFWLGIATTQRTQLSAVSPEDAWNIDTKLDDGRPAQGIVIVRGTFGSSTSCTTAANQTDLNGAYRLTNKAISCAFMFRVGA